ncbi:UNVERIFIED_CONTAM: hypothetical protein Scaly_1398400 [Sesamum calycinum]|uniref:Uncharacterized protein n=1 Tax=Sesamum calycinum TaxID=2727403 RepID=A0AAW2PMQ0_9LAMI
MERSEPTLVPEWLKNTGNVTGGGSISHSDDHAASRVARNKSFVNSNGHEFGRSSSSERTTSSYFRRVPVATVLVILGLTVVLVGVNATGTGRRMYMILVIKTSQFWGTIGIGTFQIH